MIALHIAAAEQARYRVRNRKSMISIINNIKN